MSITGVLLTKNHTPAKASGLKAKRVSTVQQYAVCRLRARDHAEQGVWGGLRDNTKLKNTMCKVRLAQPLTQGRERSKLADRGVT